MSILVPLLSANTVFPAITEIFEQVLDWFSSVFGTLTAPPVLYWALLGVGISLLGVLFKFAKKLIWGV